MIHKTVPKNSSNMEIEKLVDTRLKEIKVPDPKVSPKKNWGAFINLFVRG